MLNCEGTVIVFKFSNQIQRITCSALFASVCK